MFEWESRNIDGHVVSERYMCECMLASLCCACCNAECIGMGVLFVYTCWVCMSQLNCLCCVVVGGCFGLHPRSPPLSIRAFHPLSTHSSSTLHPLFIHSPPPFPLFIRSPSAVVACVPVRPGVQLQFRYCCLMAQVIVVPVICVGRMPAQARDRSRSRDRSWHVGDQFVIIGPPWSRWYPGKRGGWQPKFWWGHPDDPTSAPVVPTELFIDTSGTFTVTDLHVQDSGPRFVSVQIWVDGYRVWTNVAKHGVPWARQSR